MPRCVWIYEDLPDRWGLARNRFIRPRLAIFLHKGSVLVVNPFTYHGHKDGSTRTESEVKDANCSRLNRNYLPLLRYPLKVLYLDSSWILSPEPNSRSDVASGTIVVVKSLLKLMLAPGGTVRSHCSAYDVFSPRNRRDVGLLSRSVGLSSLSAFASGDTLSISQRFGARLSSFRCTVP